MYSKETYAIAEQLRHKPELRAKLRQMLAEYEKWITYSNQDFDQKQQLASWLFELTSK